jgi:hypothetical protein
MFQLDLPAKQGRGREDDLVIQTRWEEQRRGLWGDLSDVAESRIRRRCREYADTAQDGIEAVVLKLSVSGCTNTRGASAVSASTEAVISQSRSEQERYEGQTPSR